MNFYTKKQLTIITLVVGLGFLGISLPYPLFTPMIINNVNHIIGQAPEHNIRIILLGLLLSAYPLGQFLGSPILGSFSDLAGRKKTLSLSLAGTLVGYLLSGVAILSSSYELLLFSRLFTGLCEGNVAVAQAAAADMSPTLPKSISFSMINASIAIAFILGPLLGGIATWLFHDSLFSYTLPFFIAAAFVAISILIVLIFFKETLITGAESQAKNIILELMRHVTSGKKNIEEVIKIASVRNSVGIFLLFYISIDLFYEFYPLFFVGRWNFTPMQIGLFSVVYTLPYALSQGVFVSYVGLRSNPITTLKIAGLIVGIVMLAMLVPNAVNSLYLVLPLLGISIAFCSTNTAVLVSDSSDATMQGRIMGVTQSLRVLNIAIITIIGGVLGAIDPAAPLLIASIIMILASSLLLFRRSINNDNVVE